MKYVLPLLLVFSAGPLLAQGGGLVPDRTTLNGILGASEYTETFGGFTLATGTAMSFPGINSFDSTTIADSQGPNLVQSGVTYSGTTLQWNAPGYYNAVSNEVMFEGGSSITITFAAPTPAFGLDVRDFSGYSNTMTVTVFAPNDVTVLNTYSGIGIADPAIFFGYQDPGGIGMVTLTNGSGWSPIITNLSFTPIPEPSSVALIACGMAIVLAASAQKSLKLKPRAGTRNRLATLSL